MGIQTTAAIGQTCSFSIRGANQVNNNTLAKKPKLTICAKSHIVEDEKEELVTVER